MQLFLFIYIFAGFSSLVGGLYLAGVDGGASLLLGIAYGIAIIPSVFGD